MDETVELNRKIKKEIYRDISYIHKYTAKYLKLSPEKQAIQILKDNYLIQIAIPDVDWGGAIRVLPNGMRVPVINTAQPRLYQYFIYWHEIYHLTEDDRSVSISHDISTEFDLTERKADYFASQMLMSSDVYMYYLNLKEINNEFINQIAMCMDAFKAPYKAVLIQLYELAIEYDNEELQEEIRANFDVSLKSEEWIEIFKKLSLDETLVEPSYIVDFGLLKKLVDQKLEEHPYDRAYSETKEYIYELERKYLHAKGLLESGEL